MRVHRSLALAVATTLVACGGSSTDATPAARGFQVVTPDVTLAPGQELTSCYYFHTPNSEPMAIKKWSSSMTVGAHDLVLYTTASDIMPPGTVSDVGCGAFVGGNLPSWTYAANSPTAALALPADDGSGKPLGLVVAAATPAFVQVHYVNSTSGSLTAHATISADALDAGVAYTRTAAYLATAATISIPPGATSHVESRTCGVPAGARFWALSTRAHKHAVQTLVEDGTAGAGTVLLTSTDWEHPAVKTWGAPFYTFATDKLTYQCTYDNPGISTITSGASDATDEACMAIGYFFPATRSLLCVDNTGPL
jgi:hypothetical protein